MPRSVTVHARPGLFGPLAAFMAARPILTLSENAQGQVTAFARCRGEDGTLWEDVEVPISLDGEWTD